MSRTPPDKDVFQNKLLNDKPDITLLEGKLHCFTNSGFKHLLDDWYKPGISMQYKQKCVGVKAFATQYAPLYTVEVKKGKSS